MINKKVRQIYIVKYKPKVILDDLYTHLQVFDFYTDHYSLSLRLDKN